MSLLKRLLSCALDVTLSAVSTVGRKPSKGVYVCVGGVDILKI